MVLKPLWTTVCCVLISLQKVLSRVLFLTPRLPRFILRNRLQTHLLELFHLDRAMLKLGVKELSDEEVQVVRQNFMAR